MNIRVPHSSVKVKTSFESYIGHKPDVSDFGVFGSTAWDRIPLDKRKYLEPQIIECTLIVYDEEYKGYKFMDIISKRIFIERRVKFEESLHDLQLVEEETAKFLPLPEEDSRDDTKSLCYNISDIVYDINEHE